MKCLKVEDALSYLDQVKARFAGQEEIYHDFLDVMREFKSQKIGTEAVIHRVRELFEGHPDLIGGFNTFIPQGYRMDTPAARLSNTSVTNVRSTFTFSALDSGSTMKPLTTPKPIEAMEWTASSTTSTVTPFSAPSSGRFSVSILQPEGSGYGSAAQPLISANHQENLPNAPARGASITSTVVHTSNTTHSYQQQQQAQSFNHALHYVNKVKNRFQGIPDVYKQFLDILQWYQKEQRHSDVQRRKQAELQVFRDVAKLFNGQEDLLQEFSQFLPESSGFAEGIYQSTSRKLPTYSQPSETNMVESTLSFPQILSRVTEGINFALSPCRQRQDSLSGGTGGTVGHLASGAETKRLKRLAPAPSTTAGAAPLAACGSSAVKKLRSVCDVSLVDVNHLATGIDAELLHMIRMSLDADSPSGNRSYQTFLQNVALFNRNSLTANELLASTRSLFTKHSDVWRRFCDLIATTATNSGSQHAIQSPPGQNSSLECRERDRDKRFVNGIPVNAPEPGSSNDQPLQSGQHQNHHQQQAQGSGVQGSNSLPSVSPSFMSLINETAHKRLDLDFSRLRSCGTSYRALPANFPQTKCSGRQKCPIAKEVLNNSFISFSSLTSEDSQFVSSKKNQYEENMYRVEDERYEVDMVTELNRDAMKNLTVVKRNMDRMSSDELSHHHLDENLGGTSAILMRKAIHRVYGDKAGEVIHGLKNCPSKVIPVVIQRMSQKDSEWNEAIRHYQRSWAEQDARNYLRSLDHQAAPFKQRDAPLIRSKTMISQIEAIARGDDRSLRVSNDPVGDMIFASLTQPSLTARTDLTSPGTIGSALVNVNEGFKVHGGPAGPHLALLYPPPGDRSALLEDAASLIIHHVKRQSNTSKEDKKTMKFLIRTVVQDIFMVDRFPMSDDEEEEEEEAGDDNDDDYGDDGDEEEGDEEEVEGEEAAAGEDGGGRRSVAGREDYEECLDETRDATGGGGGGGETDGDGWRSRAGRPSKPKRCQGASEAGATRRTAEGSEVSVRVSAAALVDSGEQQQQQEAIRQAGDDATATVGCDRGLYGFFGHGCDRSTTAAHVLGFPKEECYSLLYGNNPWYAFFRLHHLLLSRLYLLRQRSATLLMETRSEKGDAPVQAAEVLRLRSYGGIGPADYYNRALGLVKDLLDGGEDVTTYEDRLRDMFGIYAYPWFTLDRLVINIVRQLQILASGDDLSKRLNALYRSWSLTTGNPHPPACLSSSGLHVTSSGIRGLLYNRSCRIPLETAYRSQALAVCSDFAVHGGVATGGGSVTTAGSVVVNPVSAGVPQAHGGGGNGLVATVGLTSGSSQPLSVPNCYMLVMLAEASTMLIRLLGPDLVVYHREATAAAGGENTCQLQRHMSAAQGLNPRLSPHRETMTAPGHPARHWSDYLDAHFQWSLGYVPAEVKANIRPIFLYRTVRRCVRLLASGGAAASRGGEGKPQQMPTPHSPSGEGEANEEMEDEGGEAAVQPMEATSSGTAQTEAFAATGTTSGSETSAVFPTSSFTGPTAVSFESDVWEFMRHVFKSNLSRKELFRDTFSTDYMQSIDRITTKSPARTPKINWSVGSYGIFIRLKRRTPRTCLATKKWRDFHAQCLRRLAVEQHQPSCHRPLDPEEEAEEGYEGNESGSEKTVDGLSNGTSTTTAAVATAQSSVEVTGWPRPPVTSVEEEEVGKLIDSDDLVAPPKLDTCLVAGSPDDVVEPVAKPNEEEEKRSELPTSVLLPMPEEEGVGFDGDPAE